MKARGRISIHVAREKPTPRPEIYDLYWQYAVRRHQAFERRLAGTLQPWSDDPILRTYKFCNVFRALDRVSQYLIRSVVYADDAGTLEDRVFQIVAFRTFSNIATWDGIREVLGRPPTISDLASGTFRYALDEVKRHNGRLYTGAFILCATKAYGHDAKHYNHVDLFKHMFLASGFAQRVLDAYSFEGLVRGLEGFPLVGPFMAYQTAIDLNYSEFLEFSENDFTQAGPGAARGLKKAFLSWGEYSPADVIRWMVDRQSEEFSRLGLSFSGLFGRPLHATDCQGLFCELDKYCREAAPHLTSNRSRIKARFYPASALPPLFLPPKWNLDSVQPPAASSSVFRSKQYELSW